MDRMAKVVTRCTEPSPCESEGGGDPAGLQMEGRATESEAFTMATAGVNANGQRRERALTGERTKRKREREQKRETRREATRGDVLQVPAVGPDFLDDHAARRREEGETKLD
ncbi:hypothetical protein EDB86DRAFT_3247804 [Lactarius hatsudake]|nr:hypothetical protein EDB86DRAFT_3247804 [Lactarius hatsudake]